MALAAAVQNARHTAQQITWSDDQGNAVDLTGATLTGYIKQGGVVRAIDGALALVTAASGVFSWTYGTNDVATDGDAEVQFVATYGGGTKDKTLISPWRVYNALDDEVTP